MEDEWKLVSMDRWLIYFCLASRYLWAMIYSRTPKEGKEWKKVHLFGLCFQRKLISLWNIEDLLLVCLANIWSFFLLLWQIVCRSAKPIEMAVKEKISMFCHVEPEQVCTSILHVGKYTNISVHFCFQLLTASFICYCFLQFLSCCYGCNSIFKITGVYMLSVMSNNL